MTNAMEEIEYMLKEEVKKSYADIAAVNIRLMENNVIVTELKAKSVTEDDFKVLDEEYYSGYGGQRLFGIILFNDGSYLERKEYDGAEWWELITPPTVDTVMNRFKRRTNG